MKLLLRISYDGGAYHGFQYQTNAPTVQEVLTSAISAVMGFPCSVTGCSRTDAGVHAVGFCASVEPADPVSRGDSWCPIPTKRIPAAINSALPSDVAVTGALECTDNFHPRYSVLWKEYGYLIHDGEYPDPFTRKYAYCLRRRLTADSIRLMNEAAEKLIGRHDFAAFMASGSSVSDTTRNLMRLEAERLDERKVVVYARADGFLYNMVRILVGTLLDVASGKKTPDDAFEILKHRNRNLAGSTAPAHGLCLYRVNYGAEIDFDK